MDIIRQLDREITRLYTEKYKLLHPLRTLFWECTLRCNMACRHCGSDCAVDASTPDMPLADFLPVLDEIAANYDASQIRIEMVGGEPLVRPDLDECGRQARKRGFKWGIVSNAMLLDSERLKRLKDAGMGSIAIDVDGMQQQHTWLRLHPESWQRAIDAAALLAREGQGLAWDVITCVTPRSLAVLPELKQKLIDTGVRHWRVFTIVPMGRAVSNAELVLTPDELRRLMDFIVATREEGKISLSAACEGYLGEYEGLVRDNYYSCHSGLSVGSVRANGDISGCLSVRSDFNQGNIYRDSFCQVWEERFDNMRFREWMHTGECADCAVWNYCQGNGMHLRRADGSLIRCLHNQMFGKVSE